MPFGLFHAKTCGAKILNVAVHGLRIGNTRDPSKQSVQLLGQNGPAREITQPYPAATAKNPRELISSGRFVRERAERALTDHSIEGTILRRQPFRITFPKTHMGCHVLRHSRRVRLLNIVDAVVDSKHFAPKTLRTEQGAQAPARRDVQYPGLRRQSEQRPQSFSE